MANRWLAKGSISKTVFTRSLTYQHYYEYGFILISKFSLLTESWSGDSSGRRRLAFRPYLKAESVGRLETKWKNVAVFTQVGEREGEELKKKREERGENWVITAGFQATRGTLGSQTIGKLPSSVSMSQCLSWINALKGWKMQEQDPDSHQGKLSFLTLAHFIIPQPSVIKSTIQNRKRGEKKQETSVEGVTVNWSFINNRAQRMLNGAFKVY